MYPARRATITCCGFGRFRRCIRAGAEQAAAVGDSAFAPASLSRRGSPQVYVPFAQAPGADAVVIARGIGRDPLAMVAAVRKVVGELDRNLPVYDVKTLEQRLDEDFSPFRIISGILGWFGGVALVLTAVGVYGVLAFSVSQRTREIGIRAALGADRMRLYWLFLRQGGHILAAGSESGAGATGVDCAIAAAWSEVVVGG